MINLPKNNKNFYTKCHHLYLIERFYLQLTNIHPTFLELPVTQWASDSTFIELSSIVTSLQVVNDEAERAVKFGSDFTKVLTKSEKQRQNILQAVELSRRAFPHATRKCFNRVNATSSVIELMVSSGYDAR
ncbi:Uncharacterized protein Cc8K152 [Caligus rogercresseyi]|uniref:Uncharacterized protein Cc8K152 n=1 Tax=Caligus rogercresseyi TaxID=217165 RepID=A0A7T8JZ46_CALRO|nr:Uncharacterized protein Cc8K152 [Caligus rogercresseyi]